MRLLAACLICVWTSFAQPSPATVDVQVLDHLTGQPLRKAEVSVSQTGKRRIATSDLSGRASFADLDPGSYELTAEKLGYLWMSYGARRPQRAGSTFNLKPGERFSTTLKLTPASAISGRVADEDGDPLNSPLVQVLRQSYMNGWLELERVAQTNTDDRGSYRIAGLPPGKYFVLVIPNPYPQQSEVRYVPTYFPGSLTSVGATRVQLDAGMELENISLKLMKTQTGSLRIKVTVPGASKPEISLYLKPEDLRTLDGPMIRSAIDADGRWVYSGLVPGPFDLSVRHLLDGKLIAKVARRVAVGPANVTEVTLAIPPPVTVSGRVAFDAEVPGTISGVLIGLEQGDKYSVTEGTTFSNVSAGRSFQIARVSAGHYRMAARELPRGMYIKSVTIGGRELADSTFELAGSTQIDVLIGTRGGEITGQVRLDNSNPPIANAEVVLLREGRKPRWTRADSAGKFTFDSLAPGEYQAFAWEELEGSEYHDQDYMSRQRSARVLVEEGGRHTVNLVAIPVQ